MVRSLTATLAALSLGLAGGALLDGCGSSQTKTVSVASSPPAPQSSVTQTGAATTSSSATSSTSTAPPPTSTGATTAPTTTTHSAPEPAFTEASSQAEGASGAAALVRSHGYTPNNTAEYHPSQTLRVLVGTRTGSGDGYGQQAFFFIDGHYLGTDAKEASASVRVVSQGDTEVVLAYPLYRRKDPLCCPGGGQATVHFQLNNGRLTPLGTIPPASSSSALSRY
jgi:hypothetical protein